MSASGGTHTRAASAPRTYARQIVSTADSIQGSRFTWKGDILGATHGAGKAQLGGQGRWTAIIKVRSAAPNLQRSACDASPQHVRPVRGWPGVQSVRGIRGGAASHRGTTGRR